MLNKKIKEPKVDNNSVPNSNPVHKHMNISEIVNKYPQAEEILLDYGLHCVGCFASAFDTLEAGALIHGITDEELEEMVDRINEAILYEE